MKVTLDLDKLLSDGKISEEEFTRLKVLSAESTSLLAFNILIGFGVIAVSGATLALVPAATTAIGIGAFVLIAGLGLLNSNLSQWRLLANICVLTGSLMMGGGIIAEYRGALEAILVVSAVFAAAAVLAKSSLLTVLAVLMLSASIGARTGYFHASYFLVIQEPLMTIVLFSLLATGLYFLSQKLSSDFQRLAIVASRTSVFLVNFGFWVGSLWGERSASREIIVSDTVLAVAWALALLAAAVWAWKNNSRWMLNTTAVFAGIHFYTQWFEHLDVTPGSVLLAGLVTLGAGLWLRTLKKSEPS
ncbi:hypothetical protein [Thiomicrorhabdus xiamenensis]|uniref:DUF2157 domain-containing protein n=1 Tax=Thiomicrorhabdus xiamenensis TaxID=2739063 RepID=A0A7D4SYQ4_9GAMM|nr:hypothetical protein [Thiomicrorhabdus xiamenensis]QKI88162.1 hypothetical protein HQN79_00535 [Thiomicrorhabdus xiamenensis]